MIPAPGEVRAGTILPPALLDEVASKARADLVLAGLTLGGDADKSWTLGLYSVLHHAADVVALRADKPEAARDFVRRLDTAPSLSGPWWGMGLVDTLLDPGQADADGPLAVRVLPGGPAAKGGLRAGDRVKAIGSRKTGSVRDVQRAVVGVSQGTVLYYRGLNALRRGNPQAAREAFQQAAGQAGSTLDTGDGPSASAAAARMLKAIE